MRNRQYNNRETKPVSHQRVRRVHWGRTITAFGIVAASVIAVISLSISTSKAKEEKKNAAFIQEQKNEEVIEFTVDENLEEISTPKDNCVWGIDISHWQDGVVTEDWFADAKAAGCSFVYIQFARTPADVTTDNPVLDYSSLAIEFADAAESNGICFGFYFLTDARYESQRLAEFGYIVQFLRDVQDKNYQYNRLPLMLDHEAYGPDESKENSDKRVKMLEQQVLDLKKFGIETVIYTSASKYEELVAVLGTEQNFWLADYGKSEPGVAPNDFPEEYETLENVGIWQYTADEHSLTERGLSVVADYKPNKQQELDRNLMRIEVFNEYVNGANSNN